MFRNQMMMTYPENVQLATEKQLKDWLTAENTLKIIGVIDEVLLKRKSWDLYVNPIKNLGELEDVEQYN